MILNHWQFNTAQLNGASSEATPDYTLNSWQFNETQFNGQAPVSGDVLIATASGVAIEFEQVVGGVTASGVAVEFEQRVGYIASGVAIEFEQSVNVNQVASGVAIEFEQNVTSGASGTAVEFQQRVRAIGVATHAEKWGWDLYVTINGAAIDKCTILSQVSVSRAENEAAIAELTLGNLEGNINLDDYDGKPILIDGEDSIGIRRIFTGIIDRPELDLVNSRIKLKCTDNREEKINTAHASKVKRIGFWSEYIFGEPETTAEELEQRLRTTPRAVDFDSFGYFRNTDLLAKTTPDFTYEACDISIEVPQVQLGLRQRLVNQFKVDFEARWVRLRHREQQFEINTPTFCEYMTIPGLDYLRISSVYQTLNGFGWDVDFGTVEFTFLPDAGLYNCGNGQFIWKPPRGFGSIKYVRDENGDLVTDIGGNPVTEVTGGSSAAPIFCLGASWTGSKRWAQDISEQISITLKSPQSQSQYGVIERQQNFGYEVEFDTTDFEANEVYRSPSGLIAAGNGDWYLDKSGTPADYVNALQTSFSLGECTIIKSHRNNEVSFNRRYFDPRVELYHTAAINTATVTARGKIKAIEHRFDLNNKRARTSIRLGLSRAQGAQPNDSISFPVLDAPLVGSPQGTITYDLYQTKGTGEVRQPLVKQAAFQTPGIDDLSRNRQTTSDSYQYEVPIQNDPLTVNFS